MWPVGLPKANSGGESLFLLHATAWTPSLILVLRILSKTSEKQNWGFYHREDVGKLTFPVLRRLYTPDLEQICLVSLSKTIRAHRAHEKRDIARDLALLDILMTADNGQVWGWSMQLHFVVSYRDQLHFKAKFQKDCDSTVILNKTDLKPIGGQVWRKTKLIQYQWSFAVWIFLSTANLESFVLQLKFNENEFIKNYDSKKIF